MIQRRVARTEDEVGEGPAGAGDAADALHLGGWDVGGHHAQRHAVRQRHMHPHKERAPQHACIRSSLLKVHPSKSIGESKHSQRVYRVQMDVAEEGRV